MHSPLPGCKVLVPLGADFAEKLHQGLGSKRGKNSREKNVRVSQSEEAALPVGAAGCDQ